MLAGQQYFAETRKAGVDLTGKMHLICAVASGTGHARMASSGSAAYGALTAPYGVLVSEARSLEAVSVAMFGKVQVYAGGSFSAFQPLTTDADGKAVAASSGALAIGHALVTAVPGDLTWAMLQRPFRFIGP